jgi:hypothetical protein
MLWQALLCGFRKGRMGEALRQHFGRSASLKATKVKAT